MAAFKAIFLEHGYKSVQPERQMIEAAGGEFVDGDLLPLREALHVAEQSEAIMLRRIPLRREEIRRFRKCRILMRYGVGVDNIDLAAATEAGIIVGHVPVYCVDEVSTHAIALLLAGVRHLLVTHERIRAGGWNVHDAEPVFRLSGKTLGIVGLGTLGQAVARKLTGWGIAILAADPFGDPATAREIGVRLVPFETLLGESDFVSLHLPLLPETRHLMNARTFRLMKRGAILINTARGPVVSGPDLLAALDEGQVGFAALDVFEEEPPAASSPLRHHPRLLVTDHMAWYSEESRLELQRRAAAEVVRCCTGALPEAIANPKVLERLGLREQWKPNYLARWQSRRERLLAQSAVEREIPG